MTSRLAAVGGMSVHALSLATYRRRRGVARPGRSLMSMNALLHIVVYSRFVEFKVLHFTGVTGIMVETVKCCYLNGGGGF